MALGFMLRLSNCSTIQLTTMAIVTIKSKYQIVIPQSVRDKIGGLAVGDVLEAKVERGKITFTPKSLIDRGIAKSLTDFKQGRAYGPFETAEELVASLHREAGKLNAKKPKRPAA